MSSSRKRHSKAFSLLEVVIVVAIIAILAAIGIPRMSRGSKGANDAAVSGNLAVLRNGIDLFSAEHGGAFPTAVAIENQLLQYTDVSGATNASKTATHIYGPYLRTVPPLTVGARKGQNGIAAADANDVGWIYTEASGDIRANTTTETDDAGRLYSDY
ncbi:MAG: prepilin-type N-terminal cleavage/methylation domain-containing protein [Planctomycetota bacterium]|jgi:prepilin-type N-terminal cleavage/methylation domain-containing protein